MTTRKVHKAKEACFCGCETLSDYAFSLDLTYFAIKASVTKGARVDKKVACLIKLTNITIYLRWYRTFVL
jgi:hypothetical protein